MNIGNEKHIALANALNEIYWSSIVEEKYDISSDFLCNIIKLVEENQEYVQSIKRQDTKVAYRIPSAQHLAESFLNKYKEAIEKARSFAYMINMQFGYTVDIASVVGPYILYLIGVTDESMAFFISLGMTIANIICDNLASKHEEQLVLSDEKDRKQVLEAIEYLLEKAQLSASVDNDRQQTTKSLGEIRKIIDSDEG